MCIFKSVFRDMGSSTPVCIHPRFKRDLSADVKRCEHCNDCVYFCDVDLLKRCKFHFITDTYNSAEADVIADVLTFLINHNE